MSESDSNDQNKTEGEIKRIDSDIEENKDNISEDDDEFGDYISFPSIDENQVETNHSDLKFDACPIFFPGSLEDACRAAFDSIKIQERRPALVYLHHKNSSLNNDLNNIIFNSNTVSDHINTNYIFWSYEIICEFNKNILKTIWTNMFSNPMFDDFSTEQYPLLIGIMRRFEYKTDKKIPSGYQFETLVESNKIKRTKQSINCESLWNKLDRFKNECDENEQDLSFHHFREKTGLSNDILLEIAEYLPLNDIISAFSINIYILLRKDRSKFQLSNPFDMFTKKLLPKVKCEQIISLVFYTNDLWPKDELNILSYFKFVRSITFYNILTLGPIRHCNKYFPSLIHLCLYYDNQIDYNRLIDILNSIPKKIKRLEIHYPGIYFTDKDIKRLKDKYIFNTSVEYLLLDINHFPLTLKNNYLQERLFTLRLSMSELTKHMSEIQHIRIISHNNHTGCFLDVDQWTGVINKCPKLKKIQLNVSEGLFRHGKFLMDKAQDIQMELRKKRQTIEYEVNFL